MKKIFFPAVIIIFSLVNLSYSEAVYEASTLHNSVARSETVQDLFQKKWDSLQDKNFYFDAYAKVNWVYDFNVNTWNSGTSKYESTSLDLVRTYGSMILALPIGGFREGTGSTDTDFILAFTMTGFHYGLTKKIEIDRGTAGSETVTDYKHSQFFDDIYAVSMLWRPHVYLHAGIITNKEYKPNNDGTMDYSDPEKSTTRGFISSNILKAFNLQLNATEDKIESMVTVVKVTPMIALFKESVAKNPYIPLVSIGYSYRDEYNDEPYDAVWVKSTLTDTGTSKSAIMSDSEKDTARLNLLLIKIEQKISEHTSLEIFNSMQYISEDLYNRETEEKIDVPLFKEFYCLFNIGHSPEEVTGFKLYTGFSWYWDPAIHIHRDNGSGNSLWGWILGCNADFTLWGLGATVTYDYSDELKKLIETSDKWSFDVNAFFRI